MSESHRRGRSMFFVRVANILGQAIVSGSHDADRMLPREADIAVTHGVGRSAVREALKMLVSKGLIDSRPKRGTRVRDRQHWNYFDPDIQAWMRAAPVDATALADLRELHRIVLPAAAELAAARLDDAIASALRGALEEECAPSSESEGNSEKTEIAILTHILAASGNRFLAALAPTALTAIQFARFDEAPNASADEERLYALRAVAEAILVGQASLARLAMERCLAPVIDAAP
ncbi:transcriptional regulator, GntR family [Arboricoccus pini]|uniref:Transcriptional regulator, GntR family n=1 Tax=Arboricoccus pini TaxID=1963835 RepID=A0A212QUC2_9PROT|nr:GntR family transcriptional regulator [Arboricoccus pini]SNB63280.1 transcriptional regulator, GntR family [Arboricoccus pini]